MGGLTFKCPKNAIGEPSSNPDYDGLRSLFNNVLWKGKNPSPPPTTDYGLNRCVQKKIPDPPTIVKLAKNIAWS